LTNKAKRLLKTNDQVFLKTAKAKSYMKTKELSVESQEVIDKQEVIACQGEKSG